MKMKVMKPVEDVVIIEDEESVRDLLVMYCENMGCFRNIITASDGSMGAKKLANQEFSLILLDVNMPKKKGSDIIKDLKSAKSKNSVESVCIISGNIDKEFFHDAIKSGVKHYIVKPFSEEQFREKIEDLLKKISPHLFEEE